MMTPKAPTEPKAVRPHELARLVGVSRSLAYRWALDGTVRAVRVGRTVLVPITEVERLLAGGPQS